MAELVEIAYVCLSDLHLGEEGSLLTALHGDRFEFDPSGTAAPLRYLVDGIRELVGRTDRRPTLVVNGDLIELAFGSVGGGLAAVERFFDLVVPPGEELFSSIVFLPGNHDHHLWELARETAYCEQLEGAPHYSDPFHVTAPFVEHGVRAPMLEKVLARVRPYSDSLPLVMLYPNFAVRRGDRGVVFHHGHYCEPIYHLMSQARRWFFPATPPPASVAEVETENFAWVDFLWSVLGRSGGAGSDMERSFEMIRYPEHVRAVAGRHARRLAEAHDVPFIPGDWLEEKLIAAALVVGATRVVGERGKREVVCSQDTLDQLGEYLFGPVMEQLSRAWDDMPSDLTFVIGHTHKPFEATVESPGHGRACDVYNTGGWVLESRDPFPAVGASVVFISPQLEVAALPVFNDGGEAERPRFEVREATGHPESESPATSEFAAALQQAIRTEDGELREPWRQLGRSIDAGIERRRAQLHERFPDD